MKCSSLHSTPFLPNLLGRAPFYVEWFTLHLNFESKPLGTPTSGLQMGLSQNFGSSKIIILPVEIALCSLCHFQTNQKWLPQCFHDLRSSGNIFPSLPENRVCPSQDRTSVLHPVERHPDPAGKLAALAGLVVVFGSAVVRRSAREVDAELLIGADQP